VRSLSITPHRILPCPLPSPPPLSPPPNPDWGHYLGHWLSATALLYEGTANETLRAKTADVVATLGVAQKAWMAAGPEYALGYLHPASFLVWARLFGSPSQNCNPQCVPFYVLHKTLAGLLDVYTRMGNAQALQIATLMGDWVADQVPRVLARGGQALWQDVLSTEWGGMNDALFNLYALTGTDSYRATAVLFNHFAWSAPLAVNVDDLGGNHANTHIPEVIGDARGYELTGNLTKEAIVVNFFSIVNSSHSWSTGGSNDHEFWGTANQMGDQMDADTEESCTTYNILKVARHMYSWSANPSLVDFYERALFNGLLGNQNLMDPYDESTHSTGFIYMLPLGAAGMTKPWGASNTGFPCESY
jgi:uncharacterized protein